MFLTETVTDALTATITPTLADTAANALNDEFSAWKAMWNEIWPQALNFGLKLLVGILVFILGRIIIKLILKAINKGLGKSRLDVGVSHFVQSVLKGLLFIILIIIIAQLVGVPTASLIALLGSAGLAVGLALQGSLSNFAGGVLIMILKPFRVDDFISTANGDGTVIAIDIFYTRLRTPDNKIIVIPNGSLSNSSITNVSKEPTRRVDLNVGVAYGSDIKQVRRILQSIVDEQGQRILTDKGVDIFVSEYKDSAIELVYRFWVKSEDYWAVHFDVLERVKEKFDAEGIEIPFNQMDVHIKND